MDAHAQFRKGLTGIVGIWLTMAMMPLAELLPLTAWQLLIVRGAPGAAVFGVVILLQKGSIELPDLNLILTAVALMLACVGLFNAILAWGTNLSAVMLDMAVLVNFCFAVWHKKLVARASVVLFITAIIGSYLALRGWDVPNLNIAGLLWSLLALVANGLVIEFGAKTKQDSKVRVFWMSAALVAAGLLVSWGAPLHLSEPRLLAIAVLFGVTTGLLNFLCGFRAFSNLPAVAIGVLVLGVTPSILLSSWLILGKTLGADQLAGIGIILTSVGLLGYLLNRASIKNT